LQQLASFGAVWSLVAPASAQGTRSGPTVAERLGHPADARLLVIHADDFGMSHSVNRATIEALEQGWITSASILVPCPWFPEVVRWARTHPEADLGIHVALNSEWTTYRWGPVSPQPPGSSLLDDDGYLPLVEEQVVKRAKMQDVEAEARAQIDTALAAGIRITHLDTHMGTIIRTPELTKTYLSLGDRYKLPMLLEEPPGASVSAPPGALLVDRVLGVMPGVSREGWLDAYRELLAPLAPGVYQLIVHLAYDDEEMRGATADHPDWGAAWRQNDLDLVRNPDFRRFLKDQGFALVSWRQLAGALGPETAAAR
jgi:hypothetical protein